MHAHLHELVNAPHAMRRCVLPKGDVLSAKHIVVCLEK